MTKSEIEQATQKYSEKHIDNFHRQIGFNAGANYVNEKQPYTADDMKSLLHFIADEQFFRSYGFWYSALPKYKNMKYTIDEVIKLWEESKNG